MAMNFAKICRSLCRKTERLDFHFAIDLAQSAGARLCHFNEAGVFPPEGRALNDAFHNPFRLS
jgi:hypothetical protein